MNLRFEKLGPQHYRVHASNRISGERVIGTVQQTGAKWEGFCREGRLIGSSDTREAIAKSLVIH